MINESFTANLEYYKVFYFVAKCGNITVAAQKLFLTQPSVTKAIRKLEEQLDCVLFARTKHGVYLTPEGRMLWQKIEPACQMILSAENELDAVKSVESGTLSIVSTEMSFQTYVLPAMENFLKKHPNVKIKFLNALNDRIIHMLKNGSTDLAILHEPFKTDDMMDLHVIDVLRELMVAGPNYAYLSGRQYKLTELMDYPFVSMPEGSSTRDYLKQYFGRHGLSFDPDIDLTTIDLVIQAVENNFGLGILPERVARDKIEQGTLYRVHLEEDLPVRKAYLITNRYLPLSITAQAFIKEYIGQ